MHPRLAWQDAEATASVRQTGGGATDRESEEARLRLCGKRRPPGIDSLLPALGVKADGVDGVRPRRCSQ